MDELENGLNNFDAEPNELDVNSNLDVNENIDSVSKTDPDDLPSLSKTGNIVGGVSGKSYYETNSFTFYNRVSKPKAEENRRDLSTDATKGLNFYGTSSLTGRLKSKFTDPDGMTPVTIPSTGGDKVNIPAAQQFNLGNRSTSARRTDDINRLYEKMTYVKEKLDSFTGSGIDVSYKKGGTFGDQILGISVKVGGAGLSNFGRPQAFNFDVTNSGAVVETTTGRLITSGVYSTSTVDKRLGSIDVAAGLVSSYIWSSTIDSKYSLIDKSFESMKGQLDYAAFNKTFGGLADGLLMGLRSSADRTTVMANFKNRLMTLSAADVDSSLEFQIMSRNLDERSTQLLRAKLIEKSSLKLQQAFSSVINTPVGTSREVIEQNLRSSFDKLNNLLSSKTKDAVEIDGREYRITTLQNLKEQIVINSPSLQRQYDYLRGKDKKSTVDLLMSPFLLSHDIGYSQGQLYSRTVLMKDVKDEGYSVLDELKVELHAGGLDFFDSARHKHGESVTKAGMYVKGIGETANEGENYASFYATDKLFKSMSQLGYVGLEELKQQLSEAGVKDTDSILSRYRKNYSEEEEEEPTLLLLPFRKLQQMSQRLKNMLGTRAAFEVSADLLNRARNQESFVDEYYEKDDTNPGDLVYKLRADKFLTGNLPATLPNVQFQQLQRASATIMAQMNVTKEDIAKNRQIKEEYDNLLIGELRKQEFSPYQEIRGVIGGKQARRVLVNMGISTMSDFSYLNKEYLDKSAFGYNHIAKFNLSKSKMTPYGIAEDNFLYQSQLAATQRAFNTKEERYIYHGRESLKGKGGAAETLTTINTIFEETSKKFGVKAAKTALVQQFDFLDNESLVTRELEDGRTILEAVNLRPGLYGKVNGKFAFFGALTGSQLELTEDFRYVGGIQYDTVEARKYARRKRSVISVDVSAESRAQQGGISYLTAAPTYTDKGMKTEVTVGLNTIFNLTDGSRFGTPNIKNPVRVVEGDIFTSFDRASGYRDLQYSPSSQMPIFGLFNTSAFKGYNFDAGAEILRTSEGLNNLKSYSSQDKALALAIAFMDSKKSPELRQSVIDYLKSKKNQTTSDNNLIALIEKGALGAKIGKLDNLLMSAPDIARLSTGEGKTSRDIIVGIQNRLADAFRTGNFDEINYSINTILDNSLKDAQAVGTNIDGKTYNLYTFDERSSRVRTAAIVADIISTTGQILNPVDTSSLGKNFFEYSLVDSSGRARIQDYINDKRFRDAVQDIAAKAGFRLSPVEKILTDKKEEEILANTLVQLNLFVNKPMLIQRAVNILPSYSLTASGTADAVKLEYQYLMSASKRELANLRGVDVDVNEMSAISTAFKIVSTYGNLEAAMSSGREINVVSPFLSKSGVSIEEQSFVDDFLRYYSPSLENLKLYGSDNQQSLTDRLIIDYVRDGVSDVSIEQYKNIVRTASDFLTLQYNPNDSTENRLKATSDLVKEFSGKSISTFGCSLDINDKKRQAITSIVTALARENPFNLKGRLKSEAMKQQIIKLLDSKEYKDYGITLEDVTNAVNLVANELTGSVSVGDAEKLEEKVFTTLYQKDEKILRSFENIKRESAAETYIGGLHKIAAMSKMMRESEDANIRQRAETLYDSVYKTQAIMTVEVAAQMPEAGQPGVLSIYDKNQLYSDQAPTNISYGSSAAVLFGLDILQAIPVEFGNYTHQLLPDQIKLRQLLPEYRKIVSRLVNGPIQNATLDEIKVIQDFNDLAQRSQEAIAGIGASILQQKVAGHAMRFPGASAIATASYLLGMDEVVAGGRFTGESSTIASNYIEATRRHAKLKDYSPNMYAYGNLKIPKSLSAYNEKLYKDLAGAGISETDVNQYLEIKDKIRNQGYSTLNLTDDEFNLFNRVREASGADTSKLGILRNVERTLNTKPGSRLEKYYRPQVREDRRKLKRELLRDDPLSSYERSLKASKNVLKEGKRNRLKADLSNYDSAGQAVAQESLERLAPGIAVTSQLFNEYKQDNYQYNKKQKTRSDFKEYNFFRELSSQVGSDARDALIKASNILGISGQSITGLEDVESKLENNQNKIQEKLSAVGQLKAKRELTYKEIQQLKESRKEDYATIKDLRKEQANVSRQIAELKDLKTPIKQTIDQIKQERKGVYKTIDYLQEQRKTTYGSAVGLKKEKNLILGEIQSLRNLRSQIQENVSGYQARVRSIRDFVNRTVLDYNESGKKFLTRTVDDNKLEILKQVDKDNVDNINSEFKELYKVKKELDRLYQKFNVKSAEVNRLYESIGKDSELGKQIDSAYRELQVYKDSLSTQFNEIKEYNKQIDKLYQEKKERQQKIDSLYESATEKKLKINSKYDELKAAGRQIKQEYEDIKQINQESSRLRSDYKATAREIFAPFVDYAVGYEGKLKPDVSSIEAYKASKKIYRAQEDSLTSEDVYFHTRDEDGKNYIGYGVSEDYLRLIGGQEFVDDFKNIKDLNRLLREERQIADLSGNYKVLEAIENRISSQSLSEVELERYNLITKKVQSQGYQTELSKLESVISDDRFKGEEGKLSRADKYFKYKEKTFDYLEGQSKIEVTNKERLWIERLFNFYEGAARFTGYVERAGSPTGGSIVSQLRNVYSIDVLKQRETAENYALTTADGYNNTSLIMSAYSSYSVQGGDWDGDSYSLVKGYDTMLQDVLSSIEDRNKIKAGLRSFKEESLSIGLTSERQEEYDRLEQKLLQVEQEIELKLGKVEEQKDRLHGSALYQQAREGMRRHAASVSGLPLEVLMDNRMFDDAKIANTLEHHRNILGNLAFSEAGEVSSMVKMFSEAYDSTAENKVLTLDENIEKLRGVYGDEIVDEFRLQLSLTDQSKLQNKDEAFNAFATQIQSFYNTKASLSSLNDFIGSAAGQVLDLKTFEASQNIIGYLGTSLIGEGYNALIGLLPKAAIARSIATEFGSKTSSIGIDGSELGTGVEYADTLGQRLKEIGRDDLAAEFTDSDRLRANASRASARANSLTGSLALIQQILRDSLKPKGDGGLLDILERIDKETGKTFVNEYLETPDELDERGVNKRVQKLRTFISTEEVQKRLTPKESASLNIFGSIYLLSDYMRFKGRFNTETSTYDPSEEIKSRLASEDFKEYDIVRERMKYYQDLVEGRVSTDDTPDYQTNGLMNMAKVSGYDEDPEFRQKMAYDADFAYRQTVAEMLNVATVEERLGKYIGLESPVVDSDAKTFETSKVSAVQQVANIRNVFIRSLAGDALTDEEIKDKASGLDYIEATKDLLNTDKTYRESIRRIFNITDEDITNYRREDYVAPDREFVTEREYAQSYDTLRNLAYLQQSIHGISAEDLTYLRTTNVAGMEIKNASYSLMDTFDPYITATSESQRAMLDLIQRGKLDTPESFKSASERYLLSASEAMIEVSNKLRNKYMTEGGQIDLSSFKDSDLYQAATWIGQFTGTFDGGAYSEKKFTRQDYQDIIIASLQKDESGTNLVERAAYKNAGMAAIGQTNSLLSTVSERMQSLERFISTNDSSDSDDVAFARQQYEILQAKQLEYSNSIEEYRQAIKNRGTVALESIGQDYLSRQFKDEPDLAEETRRILQDNENSMNRQRTMSAVGLLIAPGIATIVDGGATINDRVVQMGYDLAESIYSYQAVNAIGKQAQYAAMADKAFSQNRMRTQIAINNNVTLGSLAAVGGEMLISGAARTVADFMPKGARGGMGSLLSAATEVVSTAAAISASRLLGENSYGAYEQEYEDYTQQALLDMAAGMYAMAEDYFESMSESDEVYGETEDQNIDFEVSEEDESEFQQRINLGWIEVSFVDEEGNPLDSDVQEQIFEEQGSW